MSLLVNSFEFAQTSWRCLESSQTAPGSKPVYFLERPLLRKRILDFAKWLLAEFGLACPDPPDLRFVAFQSDHHVTDVCAPSGPRTRIAGLAHRVLADFVVLAIEESLVAVRMIGDKTVGAAILAQLDEALERLFVDQQTH